jgi:hypothetical protein
MKTHFLSLEHLSAISLARITNEKHDTYDQAAAGARELAREFAGESYNRETIGGTECAWVERPLPLDAEDERHFHAKADYRYKEKAYLAAAEWSRQNGIAHASKGFPDWQYACLPFATLIELIAAEFSIKTLKVFDAPDEQGDWGEGSGPLSPERIALLKENEIYVTGEERDGFWRSASLSEFWTRTLVRERPWTLLFYGSEDAFVFRPGNLIRPAGVEDITRFIGLVKAEEDAAPVLAEVFGSDFAELSRDLLELGNPEGKAAAMAALMAA